jgi:hypothetical protein
MRLLETNLYNILKMENGDSEKEKEKEQNVINTKAFEGTLKMLKEKTGRESFSFSELLYPSETLKKHEVKENNK